MALDPQDTFTTAGDNDATAVPRPTLGTPTAGSAFSTAGGASPTLGLSTAGGSSPTLGMSAPASDMPALPAPQSGDMRERIRHIAGMAHDAIDKLEQRLASTSQGVMSTQSKGGEQVRQYGDQLRQRVDTQPLQTIAIALGAGVVAGKLFSGRRQEVRVIRVEAPESSRWDTRSVERRTSGLVDAARSRLERLGDLGVAARDRLGDLGVAARDRLGDMSLAARDRLGDMGLAARDRLGAVASSGVAQTQGLSSTLARKAGDMPAQVRDAMERVFSRSQDYGSTARSAIQSHPAVGVGAMLGVGALVATLLMQRRRDETSLPPMTLDDHGNRVAWPKDQPGLRYRTQDMIASRPVTSAAVVLGLGALAMAMLNRR